jgi:hypothetical protein
MATYLIDLRLPAPGTVCPEDAPPFSERVTDEPAEATPVPLSDVIP